MTPASDTSHTTASVGHGCPSPARSTAEPAWVRSGPVIWLRAALRWLLLFPLVAWCCRPLRVLGVERLPDGPVVLVANHASHADTAALLRALPPRLRRRVAPAAAADYFFGGRVRAALVRLVIGAFAFPRTGRTGLDRAERVLAAGWSVLLFPEGTRAGGRFRCGVGRLAAAGATIVPVGLAGTAAVLPKGSRWPRRATVTVTFGAPLRFAPGTDPAAVAATAERTVRALGRLDRPVATHGFRQVTRFARSRAALTMAFLWGVAEALVWPIVPDYAVALLVLAAPSRFLLLAVAATVGSVAGGVVAHLLGGHLSGVDPAMLPLVTDRMVETAGGWLAADGAAAVWHQPLSGIPYKVFAYQAAAAGVALLGLAGATLAARGLRILAVSAVFVVPGLLLARACPERWRVVAYGAAAALLSLVFAAGLAGVVRQWA